MTVIEKDDKSAEQAAPEVPAVPPPAAFEALQAVFADQESSVSIEAINQLVLREELVRLIRKTTKLENTIEDLQDEKRREWRSLFLKLLPLMDSLDRMIRQTGPENELASSLESLRSQFLGVLEEQEILPIPLDVGSPFDLTTCDISRQQRRADLLPDLIIQVDRRGYTYQSKILRKARVVVSALP